MRRFLFCTTMAFIFLASTALLAGEPVPKSKTTDINAATAKDLMAVPGIGKTTAARIIEFREKNGPFKSMYKVGDVQGIGKMTLDKLICAFHTVEEGPIPCPTAAVGSTGDKVNLNTATAKELTKIPGIAMKKAHKIVEFRDKNGPFRSVYEMQNIKGFGKKTVEQFLEQVTVKVNINTVTADQLKALGFKNADAIIAHRTKVGGFKDSADLGKIEGVDATLVGKITEILTVK